ncbi:MAG TPA: FecR domain-containing protein [Terriglobales bacterium]|nr:FecR domain-containing protein [Terriglobales bacterium]
MRPATSALEIRVCGYVFLAALILLGCALPIVSGGAESPSAGSIKAMIPDATDNASPLAVNEPLHWNDLLQTDAKGRVRAGLNDGSILSLGSNSQLKIVQHDASTQQTAIELNYGKLRNQVKEITQPQGKYQVKTANAVIGVIGTDFYVGYVKERTTIICYQGVVSVTPLGGAQVLGGTQAKPGTKERVTVTAGQIVIIGEKISQDETLQYLPLIEQSKEDTAIAGSKPPSRDEAELVQLINETRSEKGLPALVFDPRMGEAARKHTLLMVQHGSLSHQFPGELPLPDRLDDENIPTDVEAENVAWDLNVFNGHQALIGDPPHLRNILDPRVNVVGVSVIPSGDHVYITEDFAHLTHDE